MPAIPHQWKRNGYPQEPHSGEARLQRCPHPREGPQPYILSLQFLHINWSFMGRVDSVCCGHAIRFLTWMLDSMFETRRATWLPWRPGARAGRAPSRGEHLVGPLEYSCTRDAGQAGEGGANDLLGIYTLLQRLQDLLHLLQGPALPLSLVSITTPFIASPNPVCAPLRAFCFRRMVGKVHPSWRLRPVPFSLLYM